MFRLTALFAAAAVLSACSQPTDQTVTRASVPAPAPVQAAQIADEEQWRSTADGCACSRAQAPG